MKMYFICATVKMVIRVNRVNLKLLQLLRDGMFFCIQIACPEIILFFLYNNV